jgi:O-antigen/teichoic acid export membrane protein
MLGVSKENLTVEKVMTVYLIARGVSLFGGVWWERMDLRKKTDIGKLNWQKIRRLGEMSWPLGLYILVFTSYDRAVDSIMINHFWGAEAVARYGLAYKIYGSLIMPAYYLMNSTFPLLAKSESKKEAKKVARGLMGAIGAGIVVGTMILAPFIINKLAGPGYEEAVVVLRILMVALVFSFLGHLWGFGLIAEGGQGEMLKLGVVALGINVGLNWWLIPYFGIYGAAGVTVITEAVGSGLMGWYLRKKVISNQ